VLRRETGKVIKVAESFMFVHEKFIALFFDPLQARKTAKIKGRLMFWGYFLPTRFAEDPKTNVMRQLPETFTAQRLSCLGRRRWSPEPGKFISRVSLA
jgi:hypothetical protein